MQISERALKNWRRDALKTRDGTFLSKIPKPYVQSNLIDLYETEIKTYADRVLRMTQELMDFHLIRKRGG